RVLGRRNGARDGGGVRTRPRAAGGGSAALRGAPSALSAAAATSMTTRASSPPPRAPRSRAPRATGAGRLPPAPGRLDARARAGRDRLARLVARFPRARVLVVGDLMLDRFIRGDVWRISPEAPVPVVQVRDEGVHPGGAGNVVANLAALS